MRNILELLGLKRKSYDNDEKFISKPESQAFEINQHVDNRIISSDIISQLRIYHSKLKEIRLNKSDNGHFYIDSAQSADILKVVSYVNQEVNPSKTDSVELFEKAWKVLRILESNYLFLHNEDLHSYRFVLKNFDNHFNPLFDKLEEISNLALNFNWERIMLFHLNEDEEEVTFKEREDAKKLVHLFENSILHLIKVSELLIKLDYYFNKLARK